MATRTRYSTQHPDYRAYDDGDYPADFELMPGDRIGLPPAHKVRKALLRGLVIVATFGGGWSLLDDRIRLPDWLSMETATSFLASNGLLDTGRVSKRSETGDTKINVAEKPVLYSLSANAPLPIAREDAEKPASDADSQNQPLTTASMPPAESEADAAASEPLAPMADPSDPFQVRAVAVGLHPNLSRALLERLTDADYRNAGIAIRTALVETPDRAVFVWPRQRKPEMALFQVRFVAGAASGCRRYVVTITKDGWLTTALPMEKCGVEANLSRRG